MQVCPSQKERLKKDLVKPSEGFTRSLQVRLGGKSINFAEICIRLLLFFLFPSPAQRLPR